MPTSTTLSVHFLPSLTSADELESKLVVLVDVLRASTTIIAGLAAGAAAVVPCLEIDEARRQAQAMAPGEALLGGERQGGKIEGFDLGNSPDEYTPKHVGGRTLVFTTTNGTRGLQVCSKAETVLIGAFVNLSAVTQKLQEQLPGAAMHLLCAGTDRKVTREDVLFAGALVERLTTEMVREAGLNDQARIARDAWSGAMGPFRPPDPRAKKQLAEMLRDTQGGRNLVGIGLDQDLVAAADFDRYDVVPVFDRQNGRIVTG